MLEEDRDEWKTEPSLVSASALPLFLKLNVPMCTTRLWRRFFYFLPGKRKILLGSFHSFSFGEKNLFFSQS